MGTMMQCPGTRLAVPGTARYTDLPIDTIRCFCDRRDPMHHLQSDSVFSAAICSAAARFFRLMSSWSSLRLPATLLIIMSSTSKSSLVFSAFPAYLLSIPC